MSEFGPSVEFDVIRVKQGEVTRSHEQLATEIPFTIIANDIEVVTLLATPVSLKELAYGYLYSSGFIRDVAAVKAFTCDTVRWVAHIELDETPDLSTQYQRLYTAGCGRGVMYTSMNDLAARHPIVSSLTIHETQIFAITHWLQHSSPLYHATGCVHTAGLSESGAIPAIVCDDVGRHNTVDKVVGTCLLAKGDFTKMVLVSSGRTSSEILHKAKKCGIAVTISRGAPTHQTVLLARDLGITVVGFARGIGFTIYAHEERVIFSGER